MTQNKNNLQGNIFLHKKIRYAGKHLYFVEQRFLII